MPWWICWFIISPRPVVEIDVAVETSLSHRAMSDTVILFLFSSLHHCDVIAFF